MKRFIIPALALTPVIASAQSLGNLRSLLEAIGNLVQLALPIVVAIALLVFFWGLVKFIFSEAQKEEGKTLMIWGVVALFVMVSVWGLVRFIQTSLNIDPTNSVPVPTVPGI
jgi:hypothetical protein